MSTLAIPDPTHDILQSLDPEIQQVLREYGTPETIFAYLVEHFNWLRPQPRMRISFETFNEAGVRHMTRFTSRQIKQIAQLLRLPQRAATRSRHSFTGEEGLFLLCFRLAYPHRLETIDALLGYSPSATCEITTWTLKFIYDNWDHLLSDFSSPSASKLLSMDRLQLFARRVHEKGAPLANCWGFIDCTIRKICRPTLWQQICYNGYKHLHALKYSAVKCPDGLIYHLAGPMEGRRNDNALLSASTLLPRCRARAAGSVLYGDPAYSINDVIISPYDNAILTPQQQEFNKRMSSCREAVEWGFADIARLWCALDFTPGQRLFLSPVGIQYRVAVLLTNIHICLNGSQTSLYFRCSPPALEQYLQTPFPPVPSIHSPL
jgi:hypothetical protein